ncbi:ATP-grasp domain-containing protein [Azospirillum canadense]|uniref:ATP-grasp domain-containing protein n=1 Tax=Azospirillum canadense TaxID=403962 RepID=UPI002226F2CF|nr:ATP-grasp domain-containing protein [Azospirillum canadense]MCW2239651.1 hypothetical protein [Azospirillum canadense]
MRSYFVQIGATRDGLDPYLRSARNRGHTTVLIEISEYLELRYELKRENFDLELAVEEPSDPAAVFGVISRLPGRIAGVAAGFERYVASAAALQARYRLGPPFTPPDKAGQRWLLERAAVPVHQPKFHSAGDGTGLGFPVVVKPSNGGGGLGVYLAKTPEAYAQALALIRAARNYDGADFSDVLVEEYLEGDECSVQGLVREDGSVSIITVCRKLISTAAVGGSPDLLGFRETAHITAPELGVRPDVRTFVEDCVSAVGYPLGPFHIDFKIAAHRISFIEMGFRLSGGGIVELVSMASGRDWADEAFCLLTRLPQLKPENPACPGVRHIGQIGLVSEAELARARQLPNDPWVHIQQVPSADPGIQWSERLKSDLQRHAGLIARVRVPGASHAEVQARLLSCARERLSSHV